KHFLFATLSLGVVLRVRPSLCLVVLALFLLGSAGPANAQSVIGGALIKQGDSPQIPITVSVSAQIGPSGPRGILRKGTGEAQTVCDVVDLCVVGNQAFVVAQVKHSTAGEPEGYFLFFGFQDNGQTGDVFSLVSPYFSTEPVPACTLAEELSFLPLPVIEGGFDVSP
ncbi:MAG TPA: hypothetical protein VFZ34_25840, partial [Blastocatellia bacterium]|nr:hypothetical protein [Blastocatellia bacterium]